MSNKNLTNEVFPPSVYGSNINNINININIHQTNNNHKDYGENGFKGDPDSHEIKADELVDDMKKNNK